MQSLRCEGKDWQPARFDPPKSQLPLRIGDKAAVVSKLLFGGEKAASCRAKDFMQAKC